MPTYDPAKTTISFAGQQIIGYGESTFLKATRNEQAMFLKVGADGNSCRTRNANRSGTIEITLLGSSPVNDILSAIALADEEAGVGTGTFLFKDLNGTSLVEAQNAWVQKIADLEKAKEMGDVTWIIETDFLKPTVGGITAP